MSWNVIRGKFLLLDWIDLMLIDYFDFNLFNFCCFVFFILILENNYIIVIKVYLKVDLLI